MVELNSINQEISEEEITSLKDRLLQKEKDYEFLSKQIAQLQKDFDSYRKRIEKDQMDFIRFAEESIIKELLPVLDNFERALISARDNQRFEDFLNGVELILKQIKTVLGKIGLKQIRALGEQFNPNLHEAVAHIELEGMETETIVEELQSGYIFNNRVLRPALVTIVKDTSN